VPGTPESRGFPGTFAGQRGFLKGHAIRDCPRLSKAKGVHENALRNFPKTAYLGVISYKIWRVCIINFAHDWLEKGIQTIFEPGFSRITGRDILSHLF